MLRLAAAALRKPRLAAAASGLPARLAAAAATAAAATASGNLRSRRCRPRMQLRRDLPDAPPRIPHIQREDWPSNPVLHCNPAAACPMPLNLQLGLVRLPGLVATPVQFSAQAASPPQPAEAGTKQGEGERSQAVPPGDQVRCSSFKNTMRRPFSGAGQLPTVHPHQRRPPPCCCSSAERQCGAPGLLCRPQPRVLPAAAPQAQRAEQGGVVQPHPGIQRTVSKPEDATYM